MKTLKQIAAESVFTENQLRKLEALVLEDNFYPESCVREEIDLFLTGLGLSPSYFMATPIETIARHIEALRAAEIMATLRGEKVLRIDFMTEHEDEALYLVEESHYKAIEIEERIEDRYPHYRLQSYRTLRKARGLEHLRMYIVDKPRFPRWPGRPGRDRPPQGRRQDLPGHGLQGGLQARPRSSSSAPGAGRAPSSTSPRSPRTRRSGSRS